MFLWHSTAARTCKLVHHLLEVRDRDGLINLTNFCNGIDGRSGLLGIGVENRFALRCGIQMVQPLDRGECHGQQNLRCTVKTDILTHHVHIVQLAKTDLSPHFDGGHEEDEPSEISRTFVREGFYLTVLIDFA